MALNKKQLAAFAALSLAIQGSESGFIFAPSADVAPFVTAGLVEVNDTIKNEKGEVAVRLKPQTGEAEKPATASAFVLETGIAIPEKAARGRARGGNMYPFEQMEVGQSFYVPNTEAKPNAAKSLASTVSSATARYAVPSPDGATKTNKKGESVPVMVEVRKFVVAAVDGGARVWRTL